MAAPKQSKPPESKPAAPKAKDGAAVAEGPPKTGRPSLYSEELTDRICNRIADGDSLRKICEADDMPDRETVSRWLANEDHRAFAAKYARAREAQADLMDEEILEVARASKPETAASDRVKVLAFQWRASKLKPKVYGDRIQQEVSGPGGGPIKTEEVGTPASRKAEFLARAAAMGITVIWPD